jgi:hypothetical protein
MLASNVPLITFVRMIKRVAFLAASFLTIPFLICGCASPTEVMTEEPSSRSAAPVPGERLPDEGNFAPGTPGSSASVRW